MRFLAIVAVVVVLFGCGEGRRVGTLFELVCMPDGSVVFYQYTNSQGSYAGAKASAENCR